jgi:hypothetical protein
MKKNKIILIVLSIILLSILSYLFYFPNQQKCAPWRNIIGYTTLCKELNNVRNCAELNCNGNKLFKTKFVLENANNSGFTFSSNQVITVALQNQIITQANIWANTNAPANYSVNHITFIPNIVTSNPTQTYAGIDIKVEYKTCTSTQKKD